MGDSKKVSRKKSIEPKWRTGKKVRLNVYAGNDPICQCHDADMAELIVNAVNYWNGVIKMGDMEEDVKKLMGWNRGYAAIGR